MFSVALMHRPALPLLVDRSRDASVILWYNMWMYCKYKQQVFILWTCDQASQNTQQLVLAVYGVVAEVFSAEHHKLSAAI